MIKLKEDNLNRAVKDDNTFEKVAEKVAVLLEANAPLIDENGLFPKENLTALKDSGLMGLLVPTKHGGLGGSIFELSRVAQILSSACLSTSMIWAMHSQQVATLINHGDSNLHKTILPNIAKGDFIASVTTEYGKGGRLLSAESALIKDGLYYKLHRSAPVVTGGEYGDYYLITMRSSEDSGSNDVKLVLIKRTELDLNLENTKWDSLGMRGTQSVSVEINSVISNENIINNNVDFQYIAQKTMIPVGHIAWVSCWLGATKGVVEKVIRMIRNPKTRPSTINLKSELLLEKIARIRMKIDVVDTFLNETIKEYNDYLNLKDIHVTSPKNRKFNIKINTLKILGSEQLYTAVNELIDLIGLASGYLKNDVVPLERTLRDLRSASLMYNNSRLLNSNGRLSLLDTNLIKV